MDNQQLLKRTVHVEKLISEIKTAISIKSLLTKFAHDARIDEAFNNTIESHAYVLVEGVLVYALTMSLMRIHDSRKSNDIYSLRVLFEFLLTENVTYNLSGEDIKILVHARALYFKLKGSHKLLQTKKLRDKFIAHSGMVNGNEKLPTYSYLYDLLSESCTLVEIISVVILRDHPLFENRSQLWDGYSTKFFEVLIQGMNLRK